MKINSSWIHYLQEKNTMTYKSEEHKNMVDFNF
jgi:hypothetical protein